MSSLLDYNCRWTNIKIEDDKKDLELGNKLEAECDLIFWYMVQGLIAYRKDGIKDPSSVREATETFRSDSDTFGQFLDEKIVQCFGKNLGLDELFRFYITYCEVSGINYRKTKKEFSNSMIERGYVQGKSGVRFWKDIALSE